MSAAQKTETGNISGAHVMAAALKRHGVEVIFGQSIPAALFLAAPHHGIRQIGYRTENAGAVMADAYARISNKVPVVTAQNGPAATLLVAGLAEAYKASIPIVAIVQDVARPFADKNAFQELDHLDLFKGVAKWVRRVSDVNRIDDYVDMAFTAAASGKPGPAVLIAPIDMFNDTATNRSDRMSNLGTFPLDRSGPDPERIAEAARLLAEAKRPLIIAGGGVHVSGASEELAALQDRFAIPVATTVMGKGATDETHPLSVGVVGYFMATRSRTKHLRHLVTEADVILLIGNRTNQNGTDSWSLFPRNATFIHLDVDGQEIGRNYESVRLAGDAKLGLKALSAALGDLQADTARQALRAGLEKEIAEGLASGRRDAQAVEASDASPIRPERLMRDLDSLLTPDHIVVSDASYSSIWIANHLTSRKPGMRFLTPRGLAGLGWGLPYALGAKCARPEASVFALVGDGGFAHVWSELETARRMGLNVVVAVLNNSILGYEKHAEKVIFNEYSDACDFTPVDHAAIARGAGCAGIRIERAEDFLPALTTAFASGVTTVLDVITDEHAYPPITVFNDHSALQY